MICLYICIIVNTILIFVNIGRNRAMRNFHKTLSNDYDKMTKEMQGSYLYALSEVEKVATVIQQHVELSAWHDTAKAISRRIFDIKLQFEILNMGVFTKEKDEKKV